MNNKYYTRIDVGSFRYLTLRQYDKDRNLVFEKEMGSYSNFQYGYIEPYFGVAPRGTAFLPLFTEESYRAANEAAYKDMNIDNPNKACPFYGW